jgi:hypothetical protein
MDLKRVDEIFYAGYKCGITTGKIQVIIVLILLIWIICVIYYFKKNGH